MKAVANAVIKSELGKGCNHTNRYRVVSLDNRYQCLQLAYLIRSRYVYLSRPNYMNDRNQISHFNFEIHKLQWCSAYRDLSQ